jgi:hypothetical protein
MLLTGPAGDPGNVHRVIEKSGVDPAEEVQLDTSSGDASVGARAKRKSLGMEPIATLDGPVRAEHFEVVDGERTMHLWVNEVVTPSGVVKLKVPDGEMTLRNYGAGGDFAKSVISETPRAVGAPETPAQRSQAGSGDGDVSTPSPETPRDSRAVGANR